MDPSFTISAHSTVFTSLRGALAFLYRGYNVYSNLGSGRARKRHLREFQFTHSQLLGIECCIVYGNWLLSTSPGAARNWRFYEIMHFLWELELTTRDFELKRYLKWFKSFACVPSALGWSFFEDQDGFSMVKWKLILDSESLLLTVVFDS